MSVGEAFRVGKASPANTFLAIWMARAAGFYAARGLDLSIVDMVGGRDCGPALMAGEIELMHIGMSSVVRANAAGCDLRTIGSLSNIIRGALFTAPGIDGPEDLKGGTIGISSEGSESDPTTTLALSKIGLSRDDVTIVEIGVERLAAVRAGDVAATMLGEPHRSAAIAAGMTPIVDLLAEHIPWLYSGLGVARSTLAAQRDTFKRFVMATVEGNYLAASDARAAKQVLAEALSLTDARVIGIAYENFKAGTPLDAEVSIEGAKNIIATIATGTASRDLADYIDTSLHDELRDEGFFAAMRARYPVA